MLAPDNAKEVVVVFNKLVTLMPISGTENTRSKLFTAFISFVNRKTDSRMLKSVAEGSLTAKR